MRLAHIKPPQLVGLLLAVSVGLHFALPTTYRLDFACRACGIGALIFGFMLMRWALWLFRQSGTPARPTDRASALVLSGPFRFSRHPMYLGIVIMLLGIALWFGSWPMFIAPRRLLHVHVAGSHSLRGAGATGPLWRGLRLLSAESSPMDLMEVRPNPYGVG